MPGYVHFTKDPVRDRTYINVLEFKHGEDKLPSVHSDTFQSKLLGGWRNDTVFTRNADGSRNFQLFDLTLLPAVQPSDRSAVKFDATLSLLKSMGIQSATSSAAGTSDRADQATTTTTPTDRPNDAPK